MAVDDVFRVTVLQNVGSEITMNVLHLREAVAETVALLVAEPPARAVWAIYDALAADMSDDWQVVQIESRKISPSFDIPFTFILGAADQIVGAQPSQMIPSASALVVSLYSSIAHRRGRGRMFIPGLPETAQNEGQITEAVHAAFDTWADTWLTEQSTAIAPNTGEYRVYVKSQFDPVESSLRDVVATTVRSNLGSMRSRRAYPGFGA
jgi:hypothetical protein